MNDKVWVAVFTSDDPGDYYSNIEKVFVDIKDAKAYVEKEMISFNKDVKVEYREDGHVDDIIEVYGHSNKGEELWFILVKVDIVKGEKV